MHPPIAWAGLVSTRCHGRSHRDRRMSCHPAIRRTILSPGSRGDTYDSRNKEAGRTRGPGPRPRPVPEGFGGPCAHAAGAARPISGVGSASPCTSSARTAPGSASAATRCGSSSSISATRWTGAPTRCLSPGRCSRTIVRTAAAMARRFGLDCHMSSSRSGCRRYRCRCTAASGNVLLDRLLGATIHRYPDGEDEDGADASLGRDRAGS